MEYRRYVTQDPRALHHGGISPPTKIASSVLLTLQDRQERLLPCFMSSDFKKSKRNPNGCGLVKHPKKNGLNTLKIGYMVDGFKKMIRLTIVNRNTFII